MKEFNKYQLQQELKKELHNRKQESSKYFFYEDYITVEHNEQSRWVCVDWKGYQTEGSVMTGCEKILEACKFFSCYKVLNDNTNIVGIWTPAAAWVGNNWFPRMKEAGVKSFAWVYSPSNMSRVSTDEAIKYTNAAEFIQTFENIEAAKRWLNERG
jgi:hypothetical protein